jgi:hypothetical protein
MALFPPPWLNADNLPEAERPIAFKISTHLMVFHSLLASFHAAINLYDFCENEPGRTLGAYGWQQIAGRDGAMTIWHFYTAMEEIRSFLQKISTPLQWL